MFPGREDPFIVLVSTPAGVSVSGQPSARIDQPWPREPGVSDVYAAWLWDGRALTVRNDDWGFQPIFFCASPRRIAVSTSISVLLRTGAPPDLDDGALAVFLRLSHFLGTDTPFAAIKALPPSSCLTWRAGEGASVASAPWLATGERLSRPSAIDGFVRLFRQAVERRLPIDTDRLVVPLSGGRDSRHILFELVRAGCRPAETVTVHHYPPAGDDDAVVAPEVARAAGVGHRILPLDTGRVALEHRKNVMTSFCADRHAQMMPLVDHLHTNVIVDGLGGDILSGSQLEELTREMALFERGHCDELASVLLHAHSSEDALQAVLQPDARRRFAFDTARARVAAELRRHVDAPHPWGSFRLQNRTARSVALLPFAMLARSARVVTPYLDRDLARFLRALPASALADGQLHTEVIAHAFPEHAQIRYGHRRAGVAAAPRYYRRLSWDLAREALRMRVSPLVRRPFLTSRLIAPLATGTAPWISERRVVYLMQLEEILTQGGSSTGSPTPARSGEP